MSSAQQGAVAKTLAAIPARLQQQPYRFVLLAGLGTGSLLLAYPSIWASLSSLFGSGKDLAPPPEGTSPKPGKSRLAKTVTKDVAESTAIFWDVDNCAPPTGSSGRAVAQAIRTSMQNLDLGPIVSFKAYLELSSESHTPNATQVQLRSELQGSGVSLIDTPKSGRKDVADKMMITDLLAFAIDQPAPATIVLISGDRDFAYPLGLLRNRGYEIVLITPPIGTVPILEASANVVLTWRQDVLGVERAANGRPYNPANAPSTPIKNTANSSAAASSSPHYSSISHSRPTGIPTKSSRRPSVQSTEVFQPLITLLEQLRREGNSNPLRAAVAAKLLSIDRGIYVRAGASRWAEYSAVAEAAGIIKLGTSGPSGTEWVALNDNAPVRPKNIAPLAQSSPVPNRVKPSSTPFASSSDVADVRAFHPLIEIVKEQISQGNPKPLCAYAGTQLTIMARKGIVDAYGMAGVSSWRDYIAAAERAGVARAATLGQEGVYVVEVHPKHLFAQTTQVTPSVGRMVDTATMPTPSVDRKVSTTKRNIMNRFGVLPSKSYKESMPATGSIFNGHEIYARYSSLTQILLEQMKEGRNYSTDYFLYSIIGSSRIMLGPRLKNADEFAVFLDEAREDEIVTIEPGFKPGVRHIRLHPRLVKPGSPPSAKAKVSSDAPETPVKAKQASSAPLARSASKDNEAKDQREARELLEQLNAQQGSDSLAATSSGPVPADDKARFKLLIDILSDYEDRRIPKSLVSAEMNKRNPGIDGMGLLYRQLGCSGFTDFVSQAREKGLVVVGKDEEELQDVAGVPDYWIQLC